MSFQEALSWLWTVIVQYLSPLPVLIGEGSVLAYLVGHFLEMRRVKAEQAIKAYYAMMDNVHRYSMTYYLPMAEAAGGLAGYLTRKTISETDDRMAFFWFARFHALAQRMIDEHMTYFLSNFEAEKAASKIQSEIQKSPGFDQVAFSSLPLYVTPKTLFVHLDREIDGGGELGSMFRKFQDWLNTERARESGKSIDESSKLAWAYDELIIYELNTISKAWYRRKPDRISKDSMTRIRDKDRAPHYMRRMPRKFVAVQDKLLAVTSSKR